MARSHPVPRSVMFILQSVAAGGMETHVIDLATEYARRGIETKAIVPPDEALDGVAARFSAGNIPVARLATDARNGRFTQVRELVRTLRLMRSAKPDVVHVQTGGATGGLAPILLGRLVTARVCITEHDVPAQSPAFAQRLARRVIDAACHAVIAVSRRNGRLRLERIGGPADRMAVVLNGVPLPAIASGERSTNREAVRVELGVGPGELVAGSVVRLAAGKGLEDLVRAAALIREHPIYVLLVGDGPLRGRLLTIAQENGIDDRLILVGQQTDTKRFVDAMDLFVLPVPEGSMSIALLECMARGAPPMITFCGPEEAVIPGVSGFCAPPSDPPGLADAIERALHDPAALSAAGTSARNHVAEHFGIGRVADDTLSVYECKRGAIPPRLRIDASPDPYPGRRSDE
jgi:glycosyltransferase involved in cell wall biosynthesis